MEELLQAIANSSIEQQASLLPQALEYGELGIDFLIDRLNDPELEVRAKAYELLQHNQSQKVQQAIAPGLLLNSGDRVYSVYQSGTSFDDSGYYLNDYVAYLDELDFLVYGEEFFYFHEEMEFCKSKRLFCYLNQEEAEEKAEALHRELIQKEGIGGLGFEWEPKDSSFEQWCVEHDIDYDQNNWKSRGDVLDYLYLPENIELLSKFWKDGIGHFAFVQEEFVQQKVHLRIEEKLTQRTFEAEIIAEFIARSKDHQQESFNLLIRAWSSDHHKIYLLPEFLKHGEAGMDFLVKCLGDRELQTRAKAYELLQDVDSVKARNSIIKGLLLNPGDKIYSVYQSGVGFDDQMYYMLRDDIDYIEQLHSQINNSHKYDSREYSQRIYCFTDKKQAKEAAQTLHRKLIKEKNFALDWRKENSNFDLKTWCLDNNIAYKDEWDEFKWGDIDSYTAIFEIKELISDDEQLSDNLRRSKYIYHPRHMDTWCKDNHISYEQIFDDHHPDYWHNYGKVLDYINLPENIELLSKFWKDGEGNFAFVKEEIVLQKVCIKIGEELHSQAKASNLFAVSAEYREAAGNLLVKLLENSKTQTESKSKARKILQDLDWDEIPF